jgi:hypothetical protein
MVSFHLLDATIKKNLLSGILTFNGTEKKMLVLHFQGVILGKDTIALITSRIGKHF